MQAESSIIAGSINTLGSERGGNITLTSNAGDVTVPELEATSAGGNNGEITINANTGSIEVGTINLTIEDGGRDNPFSNSSNSSNGDSQENITADADTANGQTGEVSLQAHNDITINEAIESAEISSLKLTAGRNVNINADIDTSAGNGDIRVEANSQNANPELRETGPGSVNMAAGTTLNAGAGDIVVTLELGEIGEVGNINLANLTTTGTITVNANGGDILRVGENSVINAGMAAFRTSGNGSIGSLEVPLRLDADNLEAISGRGGAFFEVLSGITVGGVRDDLTGITTEGGDVEMNVAGNLTVRENISASINLGDGGNITLESGGAIQISAATMTSTATEGAGGDVTLEAVGEINTGSINSSGSTSGGAINITSSGGGIATENSLSSSGYSTEVGGNVTLEAAGDINTGSINSSGSTSGGAISITSSEGRIDTAGGNLDTSSEQGTAGNAILTADRNITTSNIDATGGQQSGNITIESRFGDVDISRGQLEINSENGTDGNLNIQAFTGSISLGDIDGTRNLTVAPDGEGNPFGDSEPSSSITSDADLINSRSGTVTLQAHNDITINERIESSSLNDLELRAGRNININADIDTSGSNGNIALKANDEGANADYRMPGAGSVRMATGTTLEAGSGDIVILLGNFGGDPANIGNITLGNLATTGSVTVNAGGGNIFRASPNSLVRAGSVLFETGGSGGIGSPRERLRVSVDNLEAIAGSGGAFFRSPTQGLTIAGITTAGGGDVGVRVNGDITVTAPISTAIPSGDAGNITLIAEGNGNIDTSAAGLDASSFSELNNGGTVKLEAGGNITSGDILTFAGATSTSTTISSAGDGGSIVLNSGGDVNTSAGSINSSAFSELGNGGNVTFKGDGNITTGNVYAYSWLIGNGGNISLESGGNIDTSRGRLNSYSWSGNGGNVKLATTGSGNIRTGDIYSRAGINGQGGSIILNSVGDINTTAIDETNPTWLDAGAGGGEGSGGDIELRAGGDILTGDIRTFAGGTGEGGDITIDAGGSVDTAGGRVFSSSVEGNTGSISITAETEVTTGDVNLASGFRVDEKAREENPDVKPTPEPVAPTSGVAGDITITSSNGTIDTSAGELDSRSPDGSGNITLSAPGNITTGTINASALNQVKPTEGGDIEITSSEGDINATGPLETFSEIGTAGNVTLDAAGSANTRDILSDGDERGGDIAITSDSENTINVRGRLDTFSENGTAGDVTLNAVGSVNARDIRTFGQTQSGNITINSGSNVTTGSITTQAPGGDSGNIRVNGQNVATGNLRSLGRDSAGGIRVQATDGSIRTEDIEVRSEEGTAGPVELEATEDIETEDIEVTAQEGDAEIDLQAGGDITGGDQTATTEDGSASITNTAEGNINLRDQIATATGGDASINNVAGGNITAGDQTAVADGGDASINNVAGGNITAGDQTAVADGGDASINNEAGGDITAGDQTAISFGGDATITNIAEGDITVGDQTALSEGGNAFINNEAGGNLTTGDQTAVAPDGINQVTNNAGGTINTGELTEGGSDITPFLRNNPVLLVENDVAQSPTTTSVSPTATLPTPSVSTPVVTTQTPTPSVSTPVVTTQTPTPSVSTPVVTTQTPTPSVSTPVVENSPTAIATNDSLSNNSSIQNAVTATGNPQSSSNSNSSITSSTSDTQQTLETISAINSSPMSVAANTQTLTMLEESRNQEFAEYLGLDLSLDASAIKNAREVLALMTEQTGKHSAVVYVSLYAEELQLILYTAEGEPILKTIPGVKREEVIETVQQFRANIVTSLRLRNLKTYLPPAQQLYQWLIAPLAAELESANIDTLLFSMDEGLRGLPVAALHDGEQFLIERYSLSMIPSISLMDSRYNSVKDTQVLAMGASEFTELNSLPAVPVELETITTELWQGNALIDEEFTVSNLIAQRQQQTYPIIHLATHGEFKAGDAGNSYIQFWGEEKLPLDRVRELGLNNPPVELLVLSACRTAVGDSNAELGFAGLAVAAGAKSALASLWYVSDEGTLGLMTEFYGHLDDVTIKAEALREAQLAMLRGEVEVTDGQLRGSSRGTVLLPTGLAHLENNNLSHPYYWSGFTMIGSPW
jgi:CHAT domain-containing protein